MARGNNKGQSKLSARAGERARAYDTDSRISVSTKEGQGMPPIALLDQYARSHEGNIGAKISELDAAPKGAGDRFKFIDNLDLQKKSGRNALRDILTRDVVKDEFLSKHGVALTVRSYPNDFLDPIPCGIQVTIVTSPEHAAEAESRIRGIIDAYRKDIDKNNTTFEATISTRTRAGERINDQFV